MTVSSVCCFINKIRYIKSYKIKTFDIWLIFKFCFTGSWKNFRKNRSTLFRFCKTSSSKYFIHQTYTCVYEGNKQISLSQAWIYMQSIQNCFHGCKYVNNIREYWRGNQKWTIQGKWQHRVHNTRKNNTICVWHHYVQTNTNNINKTWALLQTTGSKDEPNIVLVKFTDKQVLFLKITKSL